MDTATKWTRIVRMNRDNHPTTNLERQVAKVLGVHPGRPIGRRMVARVISKM